MKPIILLASGREFDLMNPTPDQVHLDDIAHALGRLCRFTGHTTALYSVAQHCVETSYYVPPEYAAAALMHDAAEAYIGDVSAPLKAMLPDYRAIEARVEAAIFRRFGLSNDGAEWVKNADLFMLAWERRDLMPAGGEKWEVESKFKLPRGRLGVMAFGPVASRAFLDRASMLGVV